MTRRGTGAVLAGLALAGAPAAAQDTTVAAATASVRGPTSPWVPPLASLVVPGAGQLLLGQQRGMVYLAIEAFTLGAYIRQSALARQEGDLFRDLAFQVARRDFGPTVRDTAFEYFETMAHYAESGAYDLDPGPALVPETDPATMPSSRIAVSAPTGRGAEPQVFTTVASTTRCPSHTHWRALLKTCRSTLSMVALLFGLA